MRNCVLLPALFLLIVSPLAFGERKWVQVTTPHFVVVSDGGAGEARTVAEELENFRVALQATMPGLRVDPNVPVTVVAHRDYDSFVEFNPGLPRKMIGQLYGTRDQKMISIRLDSTHWRHDVKAGAESNIAYREYVYIVERVNFHNLPAWLSAGTASFFSSFDTEGKVSKVGRPLQGYASTVYGGMPIPFRELLSRSMRVGHDELRIHQFYAESWALVHYLVVADNGSHAGELAQFIESLRRGSLHYKEAAQQAFGDLDQLQDKVEHYVRAFSLPYRTYPLPPQVTAGDLSVTELSPGQAMALKATALALHHRAEAAAAIEAAIQADPKVGLAYQTRGFLQFRKGQVAEATKSFEQAVALDPKLYLATFYRTMLQAHQAKTAEEQQLVIQGLRHVLELNPRFAPAYAALSDQLAQSAATQDDAVKAARTAMGLEPARPGFSIDFARIALHAGDFAEALTAAQRAQVLAESEVETRTALTLTIDAQMCLQNPKCHRPTVPAYVPIPLQHAADADSVAPPTTPRNNPVGLPETDPEVVIADFSMSRGTIAALHCQRDDPSISLAVEDKTEKYVWRGVHLFYPDTTWFDMGFASTCDVLPGAKATIRYKPLAAGETPEANTVEIVEWGPPPATAVAPATPSGAATSQK